MWSCHSINFFFIFCNVVNTQSSHSISKCVRKIILNVDQKYIGLLKYNLLYDGSILTLWAIQIFNKAHSICKRVKLYYKKHRSKLSIYVIAIFNWPLKESINFFGFSISLWCGNSLYYVLPYFQLVKKISFLSRFV